MGNTAIKTIPGFKWTIGRAYIAMPSDMERAAYLRDCFLNWQVCVWTEDGAFHNRVPIDPEVLSFVTFPSDNKSVGSPVIYATDDQFQQPVIVARLAMRTELGDGKENQFKFRRKLGDQLVEINGSANDTAINLIVDGAGQAGQMNINIFNQNKDCVLSVDVAGDVNVTASGAVITNAQTQIELTTTDSGSDNSASFQQSTTENKFYNQKLIVNDGTDPLTLGNEMKKFLSDFIDEVAETTVVTALGLQPIVNKVKVMAFKNRLDEFLSKVGFIDK